MEGKNTFLVIILISVCLLSALFAAFLFKHIKDVESEYNEKEASLIKESMNLQDRIDGMKIAIGEKEKEINRIKKEKETLTIRVESIEEENRKQEELYAGRIKILEEEKEGLAKEIKTLKEIPLIELIQKARDAEDDENIKKMLEKTLSNIELVKSGGVVDLEPIIVNEEGEAEETADMETREDVLSVQAGAGEVLSIDRNNNLIVINRGARDKAREGMRLTILDGTEEIASGEIISSRYRISAAFIDDIKYKHTIRDIKAGDKVLLRR